jgi:integrase/recombinase XerD
LRLKALLRWIAATAHTEDLSGEVMQPRRPDPRETILTQAEAAAILSAAAPWLKTLLLLALDLGLRRSDAIRVAPVHYHAEKGHVTIRQRKTGRTVQLPVTQRLAAWLARSSPDTPETPFYLAYRREPLSARGLNSAWNAVKKRAGINRELWFHDLRRTAAVQLYERTHDLRAVEQFLGHHSLKSTCAYLEHKDPHKLASYLETIWHPNPKETIQ